MNVPMNRAVMTTLIIIVCLLFPPEVSRGENREASPEPLKVGFSVKFLNDVSRADAQVALELWIREISRSLGIKANPKPFIFDNSMEMTTALRNGGIDLIALSTLDYLNIRNSVPLEPALVGDKGKLAGGDEIVVVVRRDQGITDFGQLKGKKLIIHSGILGDSAHLWLHSVLAKRNLPEKESFLGSIQEVKKASQSVLPVFFKQADAGLLARAAFETMVELNPQLGKEMTVLLNSEKLLYGLFCFRKDLGADIKKRILDNALNMRTTPTGKQIFTLFQIENVTPFNPSYLTTTLALMNEQNRLKERISGKKTK
ncbi:MAG: hypothetical protein C0402_16945 [Thermodesulfovibrio sp.]|nr:hypothetical protein [Thermodesulfovibrio sp.]